MTISMQPSNQTSPALHPTDKPLPSVRLTPLEGDAYEAWLSYVVPDYAQERVQAGNYHPAEALQRAEQEFRELLPQGPATPGQHLFGIEAVDPGIFVGIVWFAEIQRGPRLEAFIYDLTIYEPYRRRGYALAAMLAAEDEARKLGIDRIGLHVFGYNRGAWALYDKLGYEVTNVNMAKSLAAAGTPADPRTP